MTPCPAFQTRCAFVHPPQLLISTDRQPQTTATVPATTTVSVTNKARVRSRILLSSSTSSFHHNAPLSQLQSSPSSSPPSSLEALPITCLFNKDYVTPNYCGDAREDLFTAVVYGDDAKFDALLQQLDAEVIDDDETTVDAANIKWGGRRFNQSVLLVACSRGRTTMIRRLIEKGADCTHRNDFGFGAAQYARKFYDVLRIPEGDQVIQLLVDHGAIDD